MLFRSGREVGALAFSDGEGGWELMVLDPGVSAFLRAKHATSLEHAAGLLAMPESFRLDVASLKLDAGSRLLGTFARCVEADPVRRAELLGGDPDAAHRHSRDP